MNIDDLNLSCISDSSLSVYNTNTKKLKHIDMSMMCLKYSKHSYVEICIDGVLALSDETTATIGNLDTSIIDGFDYIKITHIMTEGLVVNGFIDNQPAWIGLDKITIYRGLAEDQLRIMPLIHNRYIVASNKMPIVEYNPISKSHYEEYDIDSCDDELLYVRGYNCNHIREHSLTNGIDVHGVDFSLLTKDIGYLIGQWCTRGSISTVLGESRLVLSVPRRSDLKTHLVSTLEANNINYVATNPVNSTNTDSSNTQRPTIMRYMLMDDKLYKIARVLFFRSTIPESFEILPDEFRKGFLCGVLQTNGNITFNNRGVRSHVAFRSIRHKLIFDFATYINNQYSSTHSAPGSRNRCIKITHTHTASLLEDLYDGLNDGYITNVFKATTLTDVKSRHICHDIEYVKSLQSNLDNIDISATALTSDMYNIGIRDSELTAEEFRSPRIDNASVDTGVLLHDKHIYLIPEAYNQ